MSVFPHRPATPEENSHTHQASLIWGVQNFQIFLVKNRSLKEQDSDC